ncbi:hypothetical protein EV175_002006 [Coemansia sp. RSA 1933]|nr:hypothetical protein EV175_002006 [Coemansia sp. RSA 1933]
MTFVSSREKRAERVSLRPEDFMDAQDIEELQPVGEKPLMDGRTMSHPIWHGIGYGVDIGSLTLDYTVPGASLPSLGMLFKRKTQKHKKKPKGNKLLLSFGSALDDDDDDEIAHYGSKSSAQQQQKQPNHSGSSNTCGGGLSALERLAYEKNGAEPQVFGFVLVHQLGSEQSCVFDGPKVPATFTGLHKPSCSRWDTVPATGSQSQQLHLGKDTTSRLVTAIDRARLGIVDEKHLTSGAKQERSQPNITLMSRFTKSTNQTDTDSPVAATKEPTAPQISKDVRKRTGRTVVDWAPSQLLCKRMGVPPPPTTIKTSTHLDRQNPLGRKRAADFIDWGSGSTIVVANEQSIVASAERPDMSLFKAIFGDSS